MTAMFPLAVWQPGTLQPSTPFNDNALRVEVLQRGALSILSTPPGSPADGDVHIVDASPTGAWSSFAQNDVVLWRSGTWYRFAPFTGWLKQVGSEVRRYSGTAWEVVTGGGGGAVPVQDEGTTVVATPTAINFVGAGVTATNSGGVATVTIPGGGGGSVNPIIPTTPVRRSGSRKLLYDLPQPTGSFGSNNVQVDTYICVPFSVGRTINVTSLGIWVGTSAAGAVRLGIYGNTFSGGSDLPGSRLVQTADIDTSGSSNTFRTGAATVTLDPGNIYWLMLVKRGSASIGVLSGDRHVLGRDSGGTLITALTASATGWTEIPATAPALTQQTSVALRLAAFFEE